MMHLLKNHRLPVQIEGLPYVIGGGLLTISSYIMWHQASLAATSSIFATSLFLAATVISCLFTAFSVWFYRNPPRKTPMNDVAAVFSPADGTVLSVSDAQGSKIGQNHAKKISIFMSPLNAHINRAPVTGVIETMQYIKGKFYRANVEKASQENEHNWFVMKTDLGPKVAFVQIAGFIARRIVCYVHPGDRLMRGERFGMIRFGSRMEILIPADSQILIKKGDKAVAGLTKLARLKTV